MSRIKLASGNIQAEQSVIMFLGTPDEICSRSHYGHHSLLYPNTLFRLLRPYIEPLQ